MYIVTGGCGFIGSNIVQNLLCRGEKVMIVDRITEQKLKSMRELHVDEYVDYEEFYENIYHILAKHNVQGIFHEGAISSTTFLDSRRLMQVNYEWTKQLVDACIVDKIPLVYASSAAVYGFGINHYHFREVEECERPLNVYGFSKLMVDSYVRKRIDGLDSDVPLVGLRYFNVYGPGEEHKGHMASLAYQMKKMKNPVLFGEYNGFAPGEHRRDFVYISDVVDVNMHFMFGDPKTGIFNVGTGQSRTFNDVAKLVTGECPNYKQFPKELEGKYQCFTEADLRHLKTTGGWQGDFHTLEEGIRESLKGWDK